MTELMMHHRGPGWRCRGQAVASRNAATPAELSLQSNPCAGLASDQRSLRSQIEPGASRASHWAFA